MPKNRPTRGERGDPGWNPPRKKKEYCKNQTYCGERVHAGRLHADCDRRPTRSAADCVRPGGEFWDRFWLTFGSHLARLGSHLAALGSILDPFWEQFGHPTSLVQRATPHVQRGMPHSQALANIFCILAPSNNK